MNPQYKWPLVCAGTLAGGWLIGYVMGDNAVKPTAAATPAGTPESINTPTASSP